MAYLWGNNQPPSRRQRRIGNLYLWLGGLLLFGCLMTMMGSTVLLIPDTAGFIALIGIILACCLILAGVTLRFGGD